MGEYYPDVDLDSIYWQSPILWSSVPGVQGGIVHKEAYETSQYIKDCLSRGLLVGVDSGSHALTLWGAEFDDDTGLVAKIYISDPSNEAGVLRGLDTYEVNTSSWEEGKSLSFKKTTWINENGVEKSHTVNMDMRWLYTLTPLPEPATPLLACMGLSLLCWRRRRQTSR